MSTRIPSSDHRKRVEFEAFAELTPCDSQTPIRARDTPASGVEAALREGPACMWTGACEAINVAVYVADNIRTFPGLPSDYLGIIPEEALPLVPC
jgi:hypothetical protein